MPHIMHATHQVWHSSRGSLHISGQRETQRWMGQPHCGWHTAQGVSEVNIRPVPMPHPKTVRVKIMHLPEGSLMSRHVPFLMNKERQQHAGRQRARSALSEQDHDKGSGWTSRIIPRGDPCGQIQYSSTKGESLLEDHPGPPSKSNNGYTGTRAEYIARPGCDLDREYGETQRFGEWRHSV